MTPDQEAKLFDMVLRTHDAVNRMEPKLEVTSADVGTLKQEMKFAQTQLSRHDESINNLKIYRGSKPLWSWKQFWREWNMVIGVLTFLGLGGAIWVYNFIVNFLHRIPTIPTPH